MNNVELAMLTNMLINEEITIEEYDARYAKLVKESQDRVTPTSKEVRSAAKASKTSKKDEYVNTKAEEPVKAAKKIDYAELVSVNVYVPEHSIHYKEQDWPVCERNLTYTLRRVSSTRREDDAFKAIGFTREPNTAYRLYEIVTYDMITNDLTMIGYVIRSSKKKVLTFLNIELLKKHQINIDKVEKALRKNIQEKAKMASEKKRA